MTLWVGDNGRKRVKQPYVGDGSQVRALEELWVGDLGGNPRLVWLNIGDLNLQASTVSDTQIQTTWLYPGAGVDSYKLYVNGAFNSTQSTVSRLWDGLSPSTTYTFRVDAYRGSLKVASDTAYATTSAPPNVRKQVTLSPLEANSYHSLANQDPGSSDPYRTNVYLYHGRYSSNWNVQRSKTWFNIPGDLRNCVQIHQVKIAVQNIHSYNGTGMTFGLGAHYDSGATAQFGSTSGVLLTHAVSRGGSTGWIDVTGYYAHEFRIKGAWGVTLEPTSTALSQYGYFSTNVQLYFDYTAYT